MVAERPARKSETSPKNSRWYIQSRYAAAKTMQTVATAATYGLKMNAPTSDRNSPTKPDRPGSPADANAKNPNATA